MNNQQINYLIATMIMGFEPVPGKECDVYTPGMVISNGTALERMTMKPYDYCGRIDLAFDVARIIRERVNRGKDIELMGLHSPTVSWLTLIDCDEAWVASFYLNVQEIEGWWESADELPYTARHKNPATAICLAAAEAVGIMITGE